MSILVFNGSIGDELNTTPIVRALYEKHNEKVSVHTRFSVIYKSNPFISKDNKGEIYHLKWAYSPEELRLHMIDHYAKLCDVTVKNRKLELFLDNDDDIAVPSSVFKKVAIDTSAGWPTRRWVDSYWIELVRVLRENSILVVEIGRNWPDCYGKPKCLRLVRADYTYFNKLTLRQTASVLSKCDAYIGCDSACSHLAAAVGIPSFVLFGPVSPAIRVHATTIPIYTELCHECWGSTNESCPLNTYACMKSISVDLILLQIMNYFKELL